MFNLSTLIKLINTNNDQTIQKKEMKSFLKKQDSQSPSIFSEYFNSINSDVKVQEFKTNIQSIMMKEYETNEDNPKFELHFKKEKDQMSYEKKVKQDIYSDMYNWIGYKFNSDDEFNQAFNTAIEKYKDKGGEIREYIRNDLFHIAQKATPIQMLERINSGKFKYVDIYFQDIEFDDVDLTAYSEALKHIPFNEKTFAKVSPEHLPEGFNPKEILEKGRTIGLGIDYVHTQMNNGKGYTGEGVSYAIIDSGTLDNNGQQHNDIHFADYQVAEHSKDIEWINHFHGRAVSYIAQEIAPNANCHYYATHNGEDMDNSVLENLKSILEKNKTLPDNQKIRFVSMSMPLYGGEEAKEVVKQLEAQGVWVYYSGCPDDNKRGYLEKIDPNGDPNDFNNYQIHAGRKGQLYVNSGDRTVPDPSSPTAYRHDSMASQSWSIPVIAGYYTLACQADPSMTPKRFMKLADKTAQIKESTEPNWVCRGDKKNKNDWVQEGRTTKLVKIKIIDIQALLQSIEAEKTQQAL